MRRVRTYIVLPIQLRQMIADVPWRVRHARQE